ncbi:MAG: restriction endonuclease [Cytophagales bacterium]|nr:restriction endonuclease [Rhizobacter sp.]
MSALTARVWGRRQAAPDAPVQPSGAAIIEGMGWNEFEQLASEGFRHRGYAVSETGGGGGRAVDMVLSRGAEAFLVDCKPWRSHAVGVAPVRELHGLMRARGAAGGFVLSSGVFTPEAVRFSEGRNIQLIDGSRLSDLLHVREEKTQPVIIRREVPFLDTTLPPAAWRVRHQPCPLCGGAMHERVQTQGPQAGQRVLGCSHFPLCEGTRELPS